MYGRFPELKIFSGTNVLMIWDSVWFFLWVETTVYEILVETNIFWWKCTNLGGNYFGGNYFLVETIFWWKSLKYEYS
jgi:hypothetical protein